MLTTRQSTTYRCQTWRHSTISSLSFYSPIKEPYANCYYIFHQTFLIEVTHLSIDSSMLVNKRFYPHLSLGYTCTINIHILRSCFILILIVIVMENINVIERAEAGSSSETEEGDSVTNDNSKPRRFQYNREFKVTVIRWHQENGRVVSKTARKFNVSRQNVIRWVKKEVDIRGAKRGTKKLGCGRQPDCPEMEKQLIEEFHELRGKGCKIRANWFFTRYQYYRIHVIMIFINANRTYVDGAT
jgi:transposase-like protein